MQFWENSSIIVEPSIHPKRINQDEEESTVLNSCNSGRIHQLWWSHLFIKKRINQVYKELTVLHSCNSGRIHQEVKQSIHPKRILQYYFHTFYIQENSSHSIEQSILPKRIHQVEKESTILYSYNSPERIHQVLE